MDPATEEGELWAPSGNEAEGYLQCANCGRILGVQHGGDFIGQGVNDSSPMGSGGSCGSCMGGGKPFGCLPL